MQLKNYTETFLPKTITIIYQMINSSTYNKTIVQKRSFVLEITDH